MSVGGNITAPSVEEGARDAAERQRKELDLDVEGRPEPPP